MMVHCRNTFTLFLTSTSLVSLTCGLTRPFIVPSRSTRTPTDNRFRPLAVSQLENTAADTTIQKKEDADNLSYSVTRGDGSTGGGGLPMPKQTRNDENDDLRRPKVGADMPKGRPSWFKVPAPSQGKEMALRLVENEKRVV